MATVSIQSLLVELAPQLPHAADAEMLQALRRAAQALCRDAYAWREEISGVALSANVKAYAIPNAAGYAAEPLKVLSVKRVSGANERELPEDAFRLNDEGKLELERGFYPTAATTDTLTIKVAWLPLDACMDYPARLVSRWGRAVVAKAAAHFQAMTGKAWSDPDKARENMALYDSLAGEAKEEFWNSGRAGMMTVQTPRFV